MTTQTDATFTPPADLDFQRRVIHPDGSFTDRFGSEESYIASSKVAIAAHMGIDGETLDREFAVTQNCRSGEWVATRK